jgi:hypothetical protein
VTLTPAAVHSSSSSVGGISDGRSNSSGSSVNGSGARSSSSASSGSGSGSSSVGSGRSCGGPSASSFISDAVVRDRTSGIGHAGSVGRDGGARAQDDGSAVGHALFTGASTGQRPDVCSRPSMATAAASLATQALATVTKGSASATACPAKRRRSTRIAGRVQPLVGPVPVSQPRPIEPVAAAPGPGQAMDTAITVAVRIESTWGLNGLQNSWEEGDEVPGLSNEVARLWPQKHAIATSIVISPVFKVMRILYIHVKGTELRYITPYSAWYHTMGHRGGAVSYIEPEPAPLTEMTVFANAVGFAATSAASA